MTKLYRYRIEYSNADDLETRVVLDDYPVVSETDKTYLITFNSYSGKQKRVLKLYRNSTGKYTKRFAYVKKTDAMLNFKTRTAKRIAWYKYWIKECKNGLKIIKEMK